MFKRAFSLAFSLVELMVTLIVVSCLIAAMAPVITKKLKSNSITVGSMGGNSGELSMDCSKFGPSCGLCYPNKCVSCVKSCTENQALDVEQCSCIECSETYGEACVKCDIENCTKCSDTNYLNSGTCFACNSGYYCDGTNKTICPIGYYCENAVKTPCISGTYNDTTGGSSASSCKSCSSKTPNCTNCNRETGICSTCADGYEINNEICEENGFDFSYDGAYTKGESTDGKVKITMTTGGTFTALGDGTGTVFLVGGGGGSGDNGTSKVCGGSRTTGYRGCGGVTLETAFTFKKNTEYEVEIGAGKGHSGTCWMTSCCSCGSDGGTTTFGTLSAAGGKGGNSCGYSSAQSCSTSAKTFDGISYGAPAGGNAANRGHGAPASGAGGSGVAIIILD